MHSPLDVLTGAYREIFESWDDNHDGVITGSEFRMTGAASYDTNKDGRLTPEEYARERGLNPVQSRPAAPAKPAATPQAMTPVPAPPRVPAGKYTCLQLTYDAMAQRMQTTTMGTLNILAGSRYRWMGQASTGGTFSYVPGTGKLSWNGGVYGNGQATGVLKQVGMSTLIEMEVKTASRVLRQSCYWQKP